MSHRFVVRKVSDRPAAAGRGEVGPAEPVVQTPQRRRGRSEACKAVYARALALWPGLDRGRLGRTHGDPRKVARLVARRTVLPEESILSLLLV